MAEGAQDRPPRPADRVVAIVNWLNRWWDAPREKSKAADWALVALTVLVAIAAFWSAHIFWRQLHDTEVAFRLEERAWIGFKFVEGNLNFTLNESFLIPTELVNTGKTPAKNVHGYIVTGVFKNGEHLDFSYTADTKHPFYVIQAGTIFPGGKITESFEAEQHGATKAEPILFTEPLKNELFTPHKSYIIVYGKIIYDDIFGTEHWTTYCRYVLHPELISDECIRYNDTDNNK